MSDEAQEATTDTPPQSDTISIPVATFIEDVGKHLEGADLCLLPAHASPTPARMCQMVSQRSTYGREETRCDDAGRTGDAAIQQLNEQYQTYVMVEQSLLRRKASLMGKLPDIHKTLDAVNLLQKRQQADEPVRTSRPAQRALETTSSLALICGHTSMSTCSAHHCRLPVLRNIPIELSL